VKYSKFLPIYYDMSGPIRLRLEPRIAIMARAEVVWEDHLGAWRGAQGKIEDTSLSGACIRVGVPIGVGARLRVKWHREEFSGIAKYCRRDGGDYVLGIQRETSEPEARTTVLLHHETSTQSISSRSVVQDAPGQLERVAPQLPKGNPEPMLATISGRTIAPPVATEPAAKVPDAPPQLGNSVSDLPRPSLEPAPTPVVAAPVASLVPPEATIKMADGNEAASKSIPAVNPSPARTQESDTYRQDELHAQAPTEGQERTTVLNKFLHIGPGRQQRNAADGNNANTKAQVNSNDAKPMRDNQANAKAKLTGLPPNQGSLLSLQDIYLAVGIMSSRLGYNIDTLSAMLDSGHLQGMAAEVKRASVLMALEAAGIPVEELIRDGSKRLDALNAYEETERKRYEEYEARKAQESAQIQLEIERMTAHCLERIKHNLGEVTQAKDAFLNWQTIKQKEAQRITDAVALFTKQPAAERPSESKPILHAVGAESTV
jgi:hypothetical protein